MMQILMVSSEPNYCVDFYRDRNDKTPIRIFINAISNEEALEGAIMELDSHNMANYYLDGVFDTADGSPSNPEDYEYTSLGWVPNYMHKIIAFEEPLKIYTRMTNRLVSEVLSNPMESNMDEKVCKLVANTMNELADSHLNPFTCNPVKYDEKYWRVDGDDVLCVYTELDN